MITSSTKSDIKVTAEQQEQYREEGYFILENVLAHDELEMLRAKCDGLVAHQEAEMDRLGTDELELSRRGSRYFVFLAFKDHPDLASFIFSDRFAEICRATVGDNALLFWEQFVVKGTSGTKKAAFSWHQDAGYVDGLPVPPYVNTWIALDDVSEDNGTIYILPYSKAGTRERVEHKVDPDTGDRIGYFGDETGVPVVAPAGSIAVFSSTSFHRSGSNRTPNRRRAYALQFAREVVHRDDGSVMGLEEWFLRNGKRVR
ncbi:MAG: phytanoyl-CoA dioxygenase family protein [Rhodothermia bacterium]|nr:phytanoyl-CoA dioxygenase family protein [Rhodothermia bacterium]